MSYLLKKFEDMFHFPDGVFYRPIKGKPYMVVCRPYMIVYNGKYAFLEEKNNMPNINDYTILYSIEISVTHGCIDDSLLGEWELVMSIEEFQLLSL